MIKSVKTSEMRPRFNKPRSHLRDWDRDFQYVNIFFETGIETFKMSITFSRLINFQNVNYFFETDKLEGITVIETGIETFKRVSTILWYN